jgi:hypothetical protein
MRSVIEETVGQKLKRHEDALLACMAEIQRLREENAKLRPGFQCGYGDRSAVLHPIRRSQPSRSESGHRAG